MEKTLSIIVPTYNMEKYLRKCLDSLIVSDENMHRLEVLVINDGSKDSSSQIAHEYEAKYPQTFRVIDKENGNYGSCINRGLKEATGKYVKVLDADDYFNPQVLDDFISYLGNTDVDLVISDFNVVDEAGTCLSEFTFDLPLKREFKLKDIPNEMNTKLLHHCITYKRKVFDRFSFKQTEGISYTDDEWIFKPMMWIDAVTYYPHTLYLYLRGREGQTFDPNVIKRTLEHRVIVAKEMTEFHEANIRFCKTENVPFVTEKLARRIKAVYNYHLILYNTAENRHRIIDFDRYLKQKSIKVYDEINMMTNNYGWHYIRQWRKLGYSNCSPALVFIRLKRYIDRKLNGKTVKIDKMPAHLKRNMSRIIFILALLSLSCQAKAQLVYPVVGSYKSKSAQGMAVWNNEAFLFSHGGRCRVLDLNTGKVIREFMLASGDSTNHVNNACFGAEMVEKSRQSVIYISECKPRHRCFVECLNDSGATLVQTIEARNKNGKEIGALTWVVDTEKRFLYGITRNGSKLNSTGVVYNYVNKYRLPKLSEGSNVILGPDDLLERFVLKFPNILQGAKIRNGILYIVTGLQQTAAGRKDAQRAIQVVELEKKELVKTIDLTYVTTNEPEDIDFYNGKCLLYCGQNGGIYEVDLNK